STSSAAAESAAVAEGSAPGRFLCSNFQEAPATSKSMAASPHNNAALKPNRMIYPRFVWVESVVNLATEKGNTPCEKEKKVQGLASKKRVQEGPKRPKTQVQKRHLVGGPGSGFRYPGLEVSRPRFPLTDR